MKNILISAAIMAALAAGAAVAQDTTPNSTAPSSPQAAQPSAPTAANQAPATGAPRIAPGSVIPVQLTKTIDAKKAKAGDPVLAKVTMDMKTNTGDVLVPKDTKVMGHVTEAQARSKEQKESQVGIAFDRAVLKSGEVPLPMSIQAVIAPPSNNASANDQPAQSSGGSPSAAGGSRTGATSGGGQSQPSNTAPNSAGPESTGTQPQAGARPQITGSTQGVVGISDLKLESGQNATQGSVLTSEKNNVKVESGTMLLLKVNQ
jgi:hypothetical protein